MADKCIIEGCKKDRKWRGLCQSCYGQARRLIDKDETTWEDLISMGLALEDLQDKLLLAAFRKIQAEKKEADGLASESQAQ